MNSKPKFCGKCGSPLSEKAKFCGKCGVPVQSASGKAQSKREGVNETQKEANEGQSFYARHKKVIWVLGSILLAFLLFGEGLIHLAIYGLHVLVQLIPLILLGILGYRLFHVFKNKRNTND